VSIWDLIEFFLVKTLKFSKSLFYNSKLLSKNFKKDIFVIIKFIMYIYIILITVFNYFIFQYKNNDTILHFFIPK